MPDKQRLDAYLVEHGMATGREKAKELIRDGAVTVNGKAVNKAAFCVQDGDAVLCEKQACAYVSRGGLKLEKALQVAELSVKGYTVLDIGASTGGFTHCLLQNGAARVYAVDVGHGQLHESLRNDPRVSNLEGTDIRSDALKNRISAASVDMITADVSFISLRQILPYALPYLKKNGFLVLLIKPQFEVGKADVGKNGIVVNRAAHVRVLRELTAYFEQCGCSMTLLTPSPIYGGAGRQRGNIEYVSVLQYQHSPKPLPDIRRLVEEAFKEVSP